MASAAAADSRGTRYRWYVLSILILCHAVYGLDRTILSVVIEPIKAEFGISDTEVGILTGLGLTIPFALACIPLGMVADRVRRTRLLTILIVGWSLMTGLSGLAVSVAMLFVARMAVGAFEAGFTPTSMSILADFFPRQRRSTAMGLFNLGGPLGIFFGLAVGGAVAAAYDWRAAFLIAGVPGLIMAAIVLLTMPEPVRGAFDDRHPAGPARVAAVLSNIWRDRALFHLMVGMAFGIVLLMSLATWVPSVLIRVYDLKLQHAGHGAGVIVGLCGGAGAALGGLLADRWGRHQDFRKLDVPIAGSLLAIGFGLAGLFAAPDATVAIVLLALCALFAQFFMGTGYGFVASLPPAQMRGATLATMLVSFNVFSAVLTTAIVGPVSDFTARWMGHRSIAVGLAATFGATLLCALFFLRARSILRARTLSKPLDSPPPEEQLYN